jgi:type IV secretory pathway VirB10-like protein
MTNDKSNSIDNDPVVVDPEPKVDVNETNSSISESKGSNIKYITIGVSIAASVLIYVFFISSKDKNKDTVDTTAIVMESKGLSRVNNNALIDNLDNLVDVGYNGDIFSDNGSEKSVLELPELPSLPETVIKNIEEEIKEVKKNKEEANGNLFSKEEVDALINERLKSFEAEMKKIRSEGEKLSQELAATKKREEEEAKNKKSKPPMFGSVDNESAIPNAVSEEEALKLEEQKKQEERELQIARRRKIMDERKGAPMFKMQGGGGGKKEDNEQESIIIADKDSLKGVKETKVEPITSKNSDLSRTVLQGKIINAILEVAINTDIKTPVRAVISRNVYSESGKNIVIPRGSKVVGNFQTMINNNMSRLEIVWNRILRPDGLNISLTAGSADTLGRGGVEGELDNKYIHTVKNALLSSIISVASAVLVEKVTNSTGTTTTTGLAGTTTTGKASDYAIIDATKSFTEEMKGIVDGLKSETPTIRVAQGTKINIVVNQDLALPIFKSN